MVARKAVVTVYVRHGSGCPHDGKPFFRGCDCVKWLRYSGAACFCGYRHEGRQHRFTADTRTWGLAEEKAQEIQKRLDAGEMGSPLPAVSQSKQPTIAQALDTFITAKESEGVSPATVRKLKFQIGQSSSSWQRGPSSFPLGFPGRT